MILFKNAYELLISDNLFIIFLLFLILNLIINIEESNLMIILIHIEDYFIIVLNISK